MARAKNNAQSKAHEFELYKLWRMLAPVLRLRTAEYLENIGIEDDARILLNIANQKAFAEKFKVTEQTLVEWNKKLEADPEFQAHRFDWMKKLTANVLSALYEAVVREGDAPRVKLWMQLIESWQEKSQVSDPAHTQEMQKQTELLEKLANQR